MRSDVENHRLRWLAVVLLYVMVMGTTFWSLDYGLVIRTGVKVSLRVKDVQGRVASGAKFLIGVMSPAGYYRRAELAATDNQIRTYITTIPKGARVSLFVHSERPVFDGNTLLANGTPSKSIEPAAGIAELTLDLEVR